MADCIDMISGQWVAHPGNIYDDTANISSSDPIVSSIGDSPYRSE